MMLRPPVTRGLAISTSLPCSAPDTTTSLPLRRRRTVARAPSKTVVSAGLSS